MVFDPAFLLSMQPIVTRHEYSRRDTMLYALGVGAGIGGSGTDELDFVYEANLKALPSMAVVLAYPGFWQKEPQYGITWQKVLHAEQSTRLHGPIPVEGKLRGETVVEEIIDKGVETGALLIQKRDVFDETDDRLVATIRQVSFLRGDGGHGGKSAGALKPAPMPETAPDLSCELPSRPEQATIYRLSGDYNPLHIDPTVAKEAGLSQPILHGLCTYGFACRALVKTVCGGVPEKMRRLDCRFTAPVYPGETLKFDIWKTSPGTARFCGAAVQRGVKVLDFGLVEYEEN
jgi:acyl dehydratase